MDNKMWDGRFETSQDTLFNQLNYSINYDAFLAHWDIIGSKAHAYGLYKALVINENEYKKITDQLEKIDTAITEQRELPKAEDEDVHMWIERLLTEKIGSLGKKLHTGRSRNDQVVTTVKLWLKECVYIHLKKIKHIIKEMTMISSQHLHTIMPGYTHLQAAQPITLAFYFMAYVAMLKRDYQKGQDILKYIDISPLGSGALAGVNYDIPRESVAKKIGFKHITDNAMDAISDRDFICDYLHWTSLILSHLSRLSEDFIIWNSPHFNFIILADAYTSGSSIMPQKKNPDALELIRGKSAVASARTNAMFGILKGLPMAYNKDLQEDKKIMYASYEDLSLVLNIMPNILKTTQFLPQKMAHAVKKGYTNATDLADTLVNNGIPFRDAHNIVGQIVNYAIKQNKSLEALTLEEFKGFSPYIGEWVYDSLDYQKSIDNKKTAGSTSTTSVKRQIESTHQWLKSNV